MLLKRHDMVDDDDQHHHHSNLGCENFSIELFFFQIQFITPLCLYRFAQLILDN